MKIELQINIDKFIDTLKTIRDTVGLNKNTNLSLSFGETIMHDGTIMAGLRFSIKFNDNSFVYIRTSEGIFDIYRMPGHEQPSIAKTRFYVNDILAMAESLRRAYCGRILNQKINTKVVIDYGRNGITFECIDSGTTDKYNILDTNMSLQMPKHCIEPYTYTETKTSQDYLNIINTLTTRLGKLYKTYDRNLNIAESLHCSIKTTVADSRKRFYCESENF